MNMVPTAEMSVERISPHSMCTLPLAVVCAICTALVICVSPYVWLLGLVCCWCGCFFGLWLFCLFVLCECGVFVCCMCLGLVVVCRFVFTF